MLPISAAVLTMACNNIATRGARVDEVSHAELHSTGVLMGASVNHPKPKASADFFGSACTGR